jgi:hypothetical protein
VGARCATRSGLVALALGGLLSLALATPSGARSDPNIPCGPAASGQTLASDGVARVYIQHGRVFGCAAADQKIFLLGRASGSANQKRVGPVALAGADAAYGLTTSGVDTISAEVVVRHLTDGQVVHRRNAITGNLPAEFYEHVDAVVVKADGSVAWTAEAGSIISDKPPKRQVEKVDRTGRSVLDRHENIRLHSLQLSGSKLTWRDGGTSRSATLQ